MSEQPQITSIHINSCSGKPTTCHSKHTLGSRFPPASPSVLSPDASQTALQETPHAPIRYISELLTATNLPSVDHLLAGPLKTLLEAKQRSEVRLEALLAHMRNHALLLQVPDSLPRHRSIDLQPFADHRGRDEPRLTDSENHLHSLEKSLRDLLQHLVVRGLAHETPKRGFSRPCRTSRGSPASPSPCPWPTSSSATCHQPSRPSSWPPYSSAPRKIPYKIGRKAKVSS